MFQLTRHLAIAAVGAALLAGITAAPRRWSARSARTRSHRHHGAQDMKQATDFFINVLGCKEDDVVSGPFADAEGRLHDATGQRQSAGGYPKHNAGALRLRLQCSTNAITNPLRHRGIGLRVLFEALQNLPEVHRQRKFFS